MPRDRPPPAKPRKPPDKSYKASRGATIAFCCVTWILMLRCAAATTGPTHHWRVDEATGATVALDSGAATETQHVLFK